MSYLGHSLGDSYPSAEVQSAYSTALADRAIHSVNVETVLFQITQFSTITQFRDENNSISSNPIQLKYADEMPKHFFFKQFSLA